ncbi:hypothetical protein PVL29_012866 [Vitis rotundifolia]|uniref:Tetraspanin-19-like n=1 Tax=Vitis rotundifolia TaxID=103349 RepID=A0AA38ZLJ5_VITRO|nr:hypothetical protein PVL29_012866 [Vitis rotundifolia]
MARLVKSFLQSMLKLVNLVMGMVGVTMILYGLWMMRVWERDMQGSSSDSFEPPHFPWFIWASIITGISFCVITSVGHIAADTANGHCLSCYMVILVSLLLLETALAADIFLNSDWEKDLPEDPTGRFDDFKDFVNSNIEMFQWIGLLIVLAQGISILLAMVLRTSERGQVSNYDSDDDYTPARNPLLSRPVQPLAYVANDAWTLGQDNVISHSQPHFTA